MSKLKKTALSLFSLICLAVGYPVSENICSGKSQNLCTLPPDTENVHLKTLTSSYLVEQIPCNVRVASKVVFYSVYKYLNENSRKELAEKMLENEELFRYICSYADVLKENQKVCSPHTFAYDFDGHATCTKCGISEDEEKLCSMIEQLLDDVNAIADSNKNERLVRWIVDAARIASEKGLLLAYQNKMYMH